MPTPRQTPRLDRPWPSIFRPRVTIGQMMLLILFAGLAMAPLAMYLQKSRIELIVATVACEVIGLPVAATLFLMATMEPGKTRTRWILALCLAPTLLIFGAFGLAELSVLTIVFGEAVREAWRGDFSNLPLMIIIYGQTFYYLWLFVPPRCPVCRRFTLKRLTPRPSQRPRRWDESFECRQCGLHASRTMSGWYRGRLTIETTPSPPSETLLDEKKDI